MIKKIWNWIKSNIIFILLVISIISGVILGFHFGIADGHYVDPNECIFKDILGETNSLVLDATLVSRQNVEPNRRRNPKIAVRFEILESEGACGGALAGYQYLNVDSSYDLALLLDPGDIVKLKCNYPDYLDGEYILNECWIIGLD